MNRSKSDKELELICEAFEDSPFSYSVLACFRHTPPACVRSTTISRIGSSRMTRAAVKGTGLGSPCPPALGLQEVAVKVIAISVTARRRSREPVIPIALPTAAAVQGWNTMSARARGHRLFAFATLAVDVVAADSSFRSVRTRSREDLSRTSSLGVAAVP
jgi:hypothetical protein